MKSGLKTQVLVALTLRGKNQTWLAKELKMNPGYLSRILNGKDCPQKQIVRIKNFLNIDESEEA